MLDDRGGFVGYGVGWRGWSRWDVRDYVVRVEGLVGNRVPACVSSFVNEALLPEFALNLHEFGSL